MNGPPAIRTIARPILLGGSLAVQVNIGPPASSGGQSTRLSSVEAHNRSVRSAPGRLARESHTSKTLTASAQA